MGRPLREENEPLACVWTVPLPDNPSVGEAIINIAFYSFALLFEKQGYYYFQIGCSLEFINTFKKASKYLSEAINQGFENEDLYLRHAICFERSLQIHDAIKSYTKSLSFNPNNGQNFYNRGVLYSKIGENESAKNDFLRNIEYMESTTYYVQHS